MRAPIAFWKQIFVCTILFALGAWLWHGREDVMRLAGLAGAATAPQERKVAEGVPVIVASVSSAEDALVLEVLGTGRAQRSVSLRSEDSGRIVELALTPNGRFAAGDVLMRLEDESQRLALELARTRLDEAERIRDRFSRLETTGAATVARLDEVNTAADIARLELQSAEMALEDRILIAPFGGVSGIPTVEAGDWIDSNVELATFDDRSVLLVEIDLPEAALARVREGLEVEARTPSFPGRVFRGTVSAINSRIDVESRTARVRVAIPNDEDLLRPGGSFTISLDLRGPRYPIVPELSLQFTRTGLHVWRVSEGKAEAVPVEMVRRQSGTVLVDGPLTEGDSVVVEGTQRLLPGKAVVISGTRGGGPS